MKRPMRKRLEALIIEHGGNMTKVAEAMGVSRTTLYTWTYQLGLSDLAGIREAPLPGVTDTLTAATIRIPEELWRWVRIEAITRDVTASALVAEALKLLRAGCAGR
jgi:transposase-like protein